MDSDCDLLPDWIVSDGWILPAGSRPAHDVKPFIEVPVALLRRAGIATRGRSVGLLTPTVTHVKSSTNMPRTAETKLCHLTPHSFCHFLLLISPNSG